MSLPDNEFIPAEVLIRRCRSLSRWCGIVVVALGTTVLGLWVIQPLLPESFDALWLMKFNAGLSVTVCGLALAFPGRPPDRAPGVIMRSLLIAVGGLAALTLFEYATGITLGVDTLFVDDFTGATYPGRVPPHTAVATILAVVGLLTAHRLSGLGSHVCDATIAATVMLVHVVVSGYVHHDLPLTGISTTIRMSPPSIAASVFVVVGLVCARAGGGLFRILSREGRGSVVLRWLLPPVALTPMLVAVIRVWGEGTSLEAFAALFGAAQSVLRIAVIVAICYLLNRSEALRKMEQARREEAERMVAMCAWTQRVRWNGEWVAVDEFLHERFGLEVTHGISEDALAGELDAVEAARRKRDAAA